VVSWVQMWLEWAKASPCEVCTAGSKVVKRGPHFQSYQITALLQVKPPTSTSLEQNWVETCLFTIWGGKEGSQNYDSRMKIHCHSGRCY